MTSKLTITKTEFELRTLTPVHISKGQERKLKVNTDVYTQDNKKYLINWDCLMEKMLPDDIWKISIILKDNPGKIRSYIASKKYFQKFPECFKEIKGTIPSKSGSDMYLFMRDGFGRPFMPGSSIKGALRTILFRYLFEEKYPDVINQVLDNRNLVKKLKGKNNITDNKILKEIIGAFSDSIMSAIIVRDIYFDEERLNWRVVKTFGYDPQNERKQGWKKSGGNYDRYAPKNNEEFLSSFSTAVECATGTFPLEIVVKINKSKCEEISNEKAREHCNKDTYFRLINELNLEDSRTFWRNLFEYNNKYMKQYLKKEVKFFEKAQGIYKVNEIINILNTCKNDHIPKDNTSTILRLGSGQGYYSITGDWIFPDHLTTLYKSDELKNLFPIRMRNGRIKKPFPKMYKTRKFLFRKAKGDLKLVPPGFVKITLKNHEQ